MELQYSVLMSVYKKELPQHLEAAMNSIWNQSIPTNDFVLVCDGPLTSQLDDVISRMEKEYNDILTVIRLPHNSGLGNALNVGINYCKNNIVARMDSDDISRPERCEKELEVFATMPDVSIVSGTVEEFSQSIFEPYASRILPEKHEDILEFAKKRNPFNHPCVMYKKNAVEASGGYQDFYLLEDYYLWIRMLQNGCIGHNLQDPLLWMRAGSDLYERRSGVKYANSQRLLFEYMNKTGFISDRLYLFNSIVRGISSISPNTIREIGFKVFMRKRK